MAGRQFPMKHARPTLLATLVLACGDTPAMLAPEPDCSTPWPVASDTYSVHVMTLYESDLPHNLAAEGIATADSVSVVVDPPRPNGTQRPQRMVAYREGSSWMTALHPDGVDWFGLGHLVEILEASRPGCTERHGAVLLLFRGERPS